MPISKLGPLYDPNRNTGRPIMSFIYIGFVKSNTDVQRMGRLSVWIPEIGGSEKDPASWITVSYASPFAGATDIVNLKQDSTKEDESQKSYGWWGVPPDLNNEVAVFFANGDITRGYWFACLFQQYMNHMVPGVAVDLTTDGGNKSVPVVEYNKFVKDSNINPASPRRPTFSALTNGLKTEGLEDDFERGSASTSARRETPSQVYGLISPRANTIHIDDNHERASSPDGNGGGKNADTQEKSVNEFIRLRTRSGTQVLIHETTGYVYINSKNGDAWLEISDAGVDVYTTNSVSFRAKQDFNIRADQSIIFCAGKDINMRAGNDISMESKRDKQVKVGRNYNTSVAKDKGVTTGGNLNMESGKDYNAKSNQNLHIESKNDSTMKAGGSHKRDGKTILDNGGGASGAGSGGSGGSGGSAGGKGPAEYDKLVGSQVGNNSECASLTKDLTGVGPTSTWHKGDNVLASRPPIGSAVASGWTGDGGYPQGNAAYGDGTKGSGGHTAVVTGYTDNGFTVLEQYNGSNGAHYRTYTTGNSGFFDANNWYTVKT